MTNFIGTEGNDIANAAIAVLLKVSTDLPLDQALQS